MRNDLTQEELAGLCVTWQARLRLQDWQVQIRFARAAELGGEVQGDCDWCLPKKAALIRILTPADYPENCPWPQDVELTVVHELLHLHGAPFDQFEHRSADDNALEVMIDSTAQALVNGWRREAG